MRIGALLGICSTQLPASGVLTGWSSGLAELGVSSLGYAVPVLVGAGGTMSVALLAFDLLVRYRPPEET